MTAGQIQIDDRRSAEGLRSSGLILPDGGRQDLWFESLDGALSSEVADPFLLGSVLFWMRYNGGGTVHVNGKVTRRLLAGLDEWQAAWALWKPQLYQCVRFTADEVVDDSPLSAKAVAAFSGGVDAAYTVRRQMTGELGWRQVDLRAGLLVQGFDIPLADSHVFDRSRARAARMLAGTGVAVLSLRTNVGQLGLNWEDAFGLGVAACLTSHAPEFGIGLIGSSHPYDDLLTARGSNPLTDHLMATGLMDIRHDGADADRTAKVRLVKDWQAARENLRVCFAGEELDRNCGRCEKCVRTILNFRVVGAGLPECFDEAPSNATIRAVGLSPVARHEWLRLIRSAEDAGCDESWVSAARYAVKVNGIKSAVRKVPFARHSVLALRKARLRQA